MQLRMILSNQESSRQKFNTSIDGMLEASMTKNMMRAMLKTYV